MVLLNDTTVAFISVHNFFYNVMIKLKFSHLSCIAAFVLSIVHEIPSCIIFHQMPCKIILYTYWVHLNFKKNFFGRTGFIGFVVNMDSVIGASMICWIPTNIHWSMSWRIRWVKIIWSYFSMQFVGKVCLLLRYYFVLKFLLTHRKPQKTIL